jgi:hypothetical protein
MAPPKQTEAERRHLEVQMEGLKAARQRAADSRASRGLEPYPERPPHVRSGRDITVHDLMANLNAGRDRCAAEKRKRDAGAESAQREAEAQSQVLDSNDLRE